MHIIIKVCPLNNCTIFTVKSNFNFYVEGPIKGTQFFLQILINLLNLLTHIADRSFNTNPTLYRMVIAYVPN